MLKNKRRKLECEINRLLIFDNCDGRYSVYTSRGYCLLADTCLEFAKNFAHNFTRYIAYPLSENSKKYLSQYIELSDKTVLAIGKHAMRYALHTDICAYYKDYGDGDGFSGKEDHVWMSLAGFENYRVGDCLSFKAEVYRYLKTSRGKMIDFGLKYPVEIRKVGEYEVPSDEQLRIQAAEQIICMDLCMFRNHCDGFCIANQEWKESMLNLLLGKVQK